MSGSRLVSVIFAQIPRQSLFRWLWHKLKNSYRKWYSLRKIESESSFFQWKMTWVSRQFSTFAHNPWWSVQDTSPEGMLSSCGCSLTLTLTTSTGIWHDAGATKSWSSVESLTCSCRISLCVRSNDDSGGWATRIIPFSLSVFSAVSITLIRQETISLANRNHLFDLQVKAGSHSERYRLLSFAQSMWIYCNRQCTEFSLMSEIESARCSGKIAEVSS